MSTWTLDHAGIAFQDYISKRSFTFETDVYGRDDAGYEIQAGEDRICFRFRCLDDENMLRLFTSWEDILRLHSRASQCTVAGQTATTENTVAENTIAESTPENSSTENPTEETDEVATDTNKDDDSTAVEAAVEGNAAGVTPPRPRRIDFTRREDLNQFGLWVLALGFSVISWVGTLLAWEGPRRYSGASPLDGAAREGSLAKELRRFTTPALKDEFKESIIETRGNTSHRGHRPATTLLTFHFHPFYHFSNISLLCSLHQIRRAQEKKAIMCYETKCICPSCHGTNGEKVESCSEVLIGDKKVAMGRCSKGWETVEKTGRFACCGCESRREAWRRRLMGL
ncbi:hypothetical protein QBC45DRAFT_483645 [Copromyces sp. CBS 386.78]|nr:hypothetical protein QBC45DRAFT_483645 [Copromyces sp. CBS 386.78]